MKKALLTLGTFALVLGGALALHAMPGHHSGGPLGFHERGDRLDRMAEMLDLTPDQKEQVGELMEGRREASRSRIEAMRQLEAQLEERLEAGSPTAEEVGAIFLELHGQRQALRRDHDELRAELESLLTPEQIEKLPARESFEGRGFGDRRFGDGRDGHAFDGHHGRDRGPGSRSERWGDSDSDGESDS